MGVKLNTWKKLGLESSETPESSEDDLEDQNTSHWGVLGVIGKVLKRRYRKCPRIVDLDICSPSYGQKNGRESNWQFDSQPLKVGNRPAPDVRFGSAIRRWKDLDEGYNFGLDLVAIRGRGEARRDPRSGRGVMLSQSPGSPESGHLGGFRDSNLGVPGICAIWMWVRWSVAEYTIGSMVVAYSRARGVVCPSESECPWLVPTPKGPRMDSNQLVLVCDAGSCNLKA